MTRTADGAKKMNRISEIREKINAAWLDGDLTLKYHIQVCVATGEPLSVEATYAWNDPLLGRVTPSEITEAICGSSLAVSFGHWMIETAASQIGRWRHAGLSLAVTIKLTSEQFLDHGLVNCLLFNMARHGLSNKLLRLELSQSQYSKCRDATERVAARVPGLAFCIDMDEYGPGRASFGGLLAWPITRIKIPERIVARLDDGRIGSTLVKAAMTQALEMGMDAMADGVETQPQLDALKRCGCQIYQGRLFARPISGDLVTLAVVSGKAYQHYMDGNSP